MCISYIYLYVFIIYTLYIHTYIYSITSCFLRSVFLFFSFLPEFPISYALTWISHFLSSFYIYSGIKINMHTEETVSGTIFMPNINWETCLYFLFFFFLHKKVIGINSEVRFRTQAGRNIAHGSYLSTPREYCRCLEYKRDLKKKKLSIFSWRIIFYNIVLVSAIHQHDLAIHRYTYVPSFLNLPPTTSHLSRLSQNAGFELLASYSKFPLAIYFTYGNVCFSATLSFPDYVHKSVLYNCISITALQIGSSVPSF